MNEWILLTLETGHRGYRRKSVIEGIGDWENGLCYVVIHGRSYPVRNSLDELRRELGIADGISET